MPEPGVSPNRVQINYGDFNHEIQQDDRSDPGLDVNVLGPNRNPSPAFRSSAKHRRDGQGEVFVL
jgi:hypothetical protein